MRKLKRPLALLLAAMIVVTSSGFQTSVGSDGSPAVISSQQESESGEPSGPALEGTENEGSDEEQGDTETDSSSDKETGEGEGQPGDTDSAGGQEGGSSSTGEEESSSGSETESSEASSSSTPEEGGSSSSSSEAGTDENTSDNTPPRTENDSDSSSSSEEEQPEETEAPQLSLRWEAGQNGTSILLSAELDPFREDTAATVVITLDAEEFQALSQPLPDGITAEAAETGGELRFVLDSNTPSLSAELSFAAGIAVEVNAGDVEVTFVGEGTGESGWDFQGDILLPAEETGWQLETTGPETELEWSIQNPEDIVFSVVTEPENAKAAANTASQSVELTATLPAMLAFPAGEAAYDAAAQQITLGGVPVVGFAGLPGQVMVEELSREDDQTLRFTLTQEGESLSALEVQVTVFGEALTLAQQDVVAMFAAILADDGVTDEGVEGALSLEARLISTSALDGEPLEQTSRANATLRIADRIQILAYDANGLGNNIYWADGGEFNNRPDPFPTPDIFFSLDEGKTWTELNESTMGDVGLKKMPEVTINVGNNNISGSWSVGKTDNGGKLPSKISTFDGYDVTELNVQWKAEPPENQEKLGKYQFIDVNSTNINEYTSAHGNLGWYYVLKTDFEFDVVLRRGDSTVGQGMTQALKKQFEFHYNYSGKEVSLPMDEKPIADLMPDQPTPGEHPNEGTITIKDVWKYNLDNTPILYQIQAKENPDKLNLTLPEKDDYFALTYDNTQTENFGAVVDKIHNGGTLYLTLTGDTEYNATKVWLDGTTTEKKRPTGEFELWRFRAGQGYNTASQVRDDTNKVVKVDLVTDKDTQDIIFLGSDGQPLTLPKYDPEGYEYVYIAREYLNSTTADGKGADAYEQVFGSINPDTGELTDWVADEKTGEVKEVGEDGRTSGDISIYNGGTISNRVKDTVTAEGTKIWKAAAFQAELGNVKVQLALQSRTKKTTEEPAGEWDLVEPRVTRELTGFTAENLGGTTVSASMPKYDYQGRELEYRWVETAIYQGSTEKNLLEKKDDGSGGSFTLTQDNNRQINYGSSWEMTPPTKEGEPYKTTITNSLDNDITYKVTKKWEYNGQPTLPPSGATVTFGIYRTVSGESLAGNKVAEFTMDATLDGVTTYPNDLGLTVTITENQAGADSGEWITTVSGLPEFDEDGRQYEYVLVEEKTYGSYLPTYAVTRDETGYKTTVTNAPGSGYRIMVRKDWIDDSDITHRGAVTITAYHKDTNEPINSITLSDGLWYGFIMLGNVEPDDVYILETKVGNTEVPLNDNDKLSNRVPQPPVEQNITRTNNDPTAIRFETEHHRYEATYGREDVGGEEFRTVTNRRLGNVDITVTKKWLDGEGDQRDAVKTELENLGEDAPTLVFRLDFAEEENPDHFEITNNRYDPSTDRGDTVTIGYENVPIYGSGEYGSYADPVQSIQNVPLEGGKVYFFGLPKYDRNGAVVRYKVEEIWVDKDGNELSNADLQRDYEDLYKVYKNYTKAVTETEYEAGHQVDIEGIEAVNRLTGTKDVLWHKQWQDDYRYGTGERPDIYLDIYQVKHDKDGDALAPTLYQANYRWTAVNVDDAYNPDGRYDEKWHWHAQFKDLPQYDENGYEILYYAVEKTHIKVSDFDYQLAEYSYPVAETSAELIPLGTSLKADQDAINNHFVVEIPEPDTANRYALKENGTFTNALANHVVISGEKQWLNLPYSYDPGELPQVTFSVDRKVAGTNEPAEQNFASLTITSWDNELIRRDGKYSFKILYTGENVIAEENGELTSKPAEDNKDASLLPKYDEQGRLYEYTIREAKVKWQDGTTGAPETGADQVYVQVINEYLAQNTYNSVRGALRIEKYLELPMDENNNPTSFPAVRFVLTRTHEVANPKPGDPEVVEKVAELTWKSEDVQKAYEEQKKGIVHTDDLLFENLPIYAPNGSKYVYRVYEDKSILGGFDTWAQKTDGGTSFEELIAGEKSDEANPAVEGLSLTQNLPDANGQDGRGETDKDTPVTASFANQQPEDEITTVEIQGKKIWDDYNNAFGLRPDFDGIELVLYRRANAQPGTGGAAAIKIQEVPQRAYHFEWVTTDKNQNTWEYQFTGVTEGELEKYAPNGMPWVYVVYEKLPDGTYRPTPTRPESEYEGNNKVGPDASYTGKVESGSTTGNVLNMQDLTNSITTYERYIKRWVDEAGQYITEDYLGFDLTVNFELQVTEAKADGKPLESGYDWESAETYFDRMLGQDNDWRTTLGLEPADLHPALTGRIDDTTYWSASRDVDDLPLVIVKAADLGTGKLTHLQYRIVETSIEYQSKTQEYTVEDSTDGLTYTYTAGDGLFTPVYRDNKGVVSAVGSNSADTYQHYNQLKTTGLTVKKVWEDDLDNRFDTRPDAESKDYDWEVHFVLQRTTDNTTWETVRVYEDAGDTTSLPLILHIRGKNTDDSGTATVKGLPELDPVTNGAYTYQVRELVGEKDWWDEDTVAAFSEDTDIVKPGDQFNTSYDTTYDTVDGTHVVINTMPDTGFKADKEWSNGSATKPVTLELLYLDEDGVTWKSLNPKQDILLDGRKDNSDGKDKFEEEPWTAVWDRIPKRLPNSTIKDDQTVYGVKEVTLNGYVSLPKGTDGTVSFDGGSTLTITNTEVVSLKVVKTWPGFTGTKDTVNIKIYRTTNADKDPTTDDEVTTNALGNTLETKLTSSNGWKLELKDLPKYDENGNLYTYYARELDENGKPIEPGKNGNLAGIYAVYYGDSKTTVTPGGTFTTNIYNVGIKDISGTKTWVDAGDSSNRPDEITLTLYRKAGSGTEELVTGVDPIWDSDKTGNTWKYEYKNLPAANDKGVVYTYRVEETVPDGYKPIYSGGSSANIRNVLTATTEVTVTKKWVDGIEDRPDSITLTLYADGKQYTAAPYNKPVEVKPTTIQKYLTQDYTWSYTFKDLPKYNTTDGKLITYTVKETVPKDHQSSGDATEANKYTITNTKLIDIPVEKHWAGIPSAEWEQVEIGLYRKLKNEGDTEFVPVQKGDADYTLFLNNANQWKGAFTDLPAYTTTDNGSIAQYVYTIKELTIGGEPTAKSNYIIHYDGDQSTGFTVTNVREYGVLEGTKTWKDNGNAYGTRPSGDLELIVYRTTTPDISENSDLWEKVESREYQGPVWKKDDNVWTYTIDGLPMVSDDGFVYYYRVEEVVPDPVGDTTAKYECTYQGLNLTNTLTEFIEIPVEKVWNDNSDAFGKRPEKVTLLLYGNDTVVASVHLTEHGPLERFFTGNDGWSYTFKGLPKYDEEGKLIVYRVEENPVPDGYHAEVQPESSSDTVPAENGFTVTNTGRGNLKVTKYVTGSRGDHQQEFPVRVVLGTGPDGKVIDGTYGDMEFKDGVADFTLKDNESKTAEHLPAGISYTVTETNAYGHRVSYTGQTGTIPVGATAEAVITNHKSGGGGHGGGDDEINVSARKVWTLDDGRKATESVRIELLRDGKHYDTVTLSEENGWRHIWRDLDDSYSWTVRELDVPSGCFGHRVRHCSEEKAEKHQ